MNYFYLDELMFRSSVEQFYKVPCTLTPQDAPRVCTVLMVFAIGAQFSHLQGGERYRRQMIQEDHVWMDDALALMFFRQAFKLVPDVLAIGSLESVQALLLMGFYLLPLGHSGLAATYLSTGLRMATNCCLQFDDEISLTAREIEVRRRVWCTAFILERQVARSTGIAFSNIVIGETLSIMGSHSLPHDRLFKGLTCLETSKCPPHASIHIITRKVW
jgi:hypothetical protein